MSRRRGFTLIEILLATAVFALVFLAVQGLFASGMRRHRDAAARTADARRVDRARERLRQDLGGAVFTGGALGDILAGGPERGEAGHPGWIEIATTTGRLRDGRVGSDLQAVRYDVGPAASDRPGGGLRRSVSRALLAPVSDLVPGPALVDGVEELEVAFFDGVQWLDAWEAAADRPDTPTAIRIRIRWADAPAPFPHRPPFELVVPWTTGPLLPPAAGGDAP